jgi:hypothetical protein
VFGGAHTVATATLVPIYEKVYLTLSMIVFMHTTKMIAIFYRRTPHQK